MAISVSGIGSGLDIESIVTQLMAVEQQPLLKLDAREAGYQARISAVASLKSAVSTFQEAASALGESDAFDTITTASSDEDIVTISATDEAASGGMAVEVLRLAQSHKQASEPKASDALFGGTAGDELTLTAGGNSLTIDLSTAQTLREIREQINAGDSGVSATLLDETGDGSAMRLVLSAAEGGYDNRIEAAFGGSIDAATFGFATVNTDANGDPLVDLEDLDASFSIDGFALTRSANSVDDAITGVTLELGQPGLATVEVGRDSGGVGGAIEGLVDAYNSMRSSLSQLRNTGLSGDSIVRNVESSVRSVLGRSLPGLGDISSLSQLGVAFTREGDLTFDAKDLNAAMAADSGAVEAFFTAENGFFDRIDGVLSGYLEAKGMLDSRVDGLNSRIDSLQDERSRWERRLETVETRLRDQFSALDGLLAQLSTTGNYLVQQLDSLPGFTYSNRR